MMCQLLADMARARASLPFPSALLYIVLGGKNSPKCNGVKKEILHPRFGSHALFLIIFIGKLRHGCESRILANGPW